MRVGCCDPDDFTRVHTCTSCDEVTRTPGVRLVLPLLLPLFCEGVMPRMRAC
jgi:hypothetical protein